MERRSPVSKEKTEATNQLLHYISEWFRHRFKEVEITVCFGKLTITHKDKILIDKMAEIKRLATSENAKPYSVELFNQTKFVMQVQHLKIFNNILYMFEEAEVDLVQLRIGQEDLHMFYVPKPKQHKES